MPVIIMFGNRKGGTGKSTVAVHVLVALMRDGYKVASVDADFGQWTLFRYLENRHKSASIKQDLKIPFNFRLVSENRSDVGIIDEFRWILSDLDDRDFIIVDTHGGDGYVTKAIHSYADILVTPVNDSFVDLDLIGAITEEGSLTLGEYSSMLWEQRKVKARRGSKRGIEWIVVRNRISTMFTKNKKKVGDSVLSLSKRLGFKVADGFCDRVIFKELFNSGETLLDIKKGNTLQHVAAKQELRSLVNMVLKC